MNKSWKIVSPHRQSIIPPDCPHSPFPFIQSFYDLKHSNRLNMIWFSIKFLIRNQLNRSILCLKIWKRHTNKNTDSQSPHRQKQINKQKKNVIILNYKCISRWVLKTLIVKNTNTTTPIEMMILNWLILLWS